MDDATRPEPVDPVGGLDRADGPRSTVYVIGDDDGCAHPANRLRHVGDDGRNSYYRCRSCGSALIVPEALVRTPGVVRRAVD